MNFDTSTLCLMLVDCRFERSREMNFDILTLCLIFADCRFERSREMNFEVLTLCLTGASSSGTPSKGDKKAGPKPRRSAVNLKKPRLCVSGFNYSSRTKITNQNGYWQVFCGELCILEVNNYLCFIHNLTRRSPMRKRQARRIMHTTA
jgi:hypothetical protein